MIAVFLTGIALSMDAFSLSVVYGTLGLSFKKTVLLSLTVGILHFLMPNFGYHIGQLIMNNSVINSNVLISIIFLILAFQMFSSYKEEREIVNLRNLWSFLLFGFTVSFDSFSVGIGYSTLNINILVAGLIFSLLSFSFTFLGLLIGNVLHKVVGRFSILLGSFVLLALGIYYFFL